MTRTSTWEALVQHPGPCDHIVQLYSDDAFLARVVTRFVTAGFAESEAAVIIGTPAHRALFAASVPGAAAAKGRGQLVMLDAAECLSAFMIDGMPDRTAFRALLAWVLNRVGATGYARTRLYGEMVNLLGSGTRSSRRSRSRRSGTRSSASGACPCCARTASTLSTATGVTTRSRGSPARTRT